MVNIVEFDDGRRWFVDVGYGGDAPTQPMLLKDDDVGCRNFGDQKARLKLHDASRTSGREARLWVYQTQESADEAWKSQYCFSETEFIHQDYHVMSYYTSTRPENYLGRSVIASKLEMEDGMIVRKIILHNAGIRVQENTPGVQKTQHSLLSSEKDRLEVIEKQFGIYLTEEEEQGILGKPTELKLSA